MDNTDIQIPTLAYLQKQRDEIIAMADRYGAYDVRVFGSVARGEASLDSDIDLLVATRPHVSMFDLVGLWLDLKELLGFDVSLITDALNDEGHHEFMAQVYADAISL